MNWLVGVALKVASTIAFTAMSTLVKLVSDRYPVGEIVFSRSCFALIPVMVWVGWHGQFPAVLYTPSVTAHLLRLGVGAASMFLGFTALSLLPIADATAIGYASPLFTVVLAVVLLKEKVRAYRWSAVVVGLIGVLIILSDYVAPGSGSGPERSFIGALMQLVSSVCGALAGIQIRRLIRVDSAATIVVYFSGLTALLALVTIPFGWRVPTVEDAAVLLLLGIFGGVGQVLMTQSFRYAEASTLAPFDYLSMIWALVVSLVVFHNRPTLTMLVGTAVVVAAGLFVIHRERKLGLLTRARSVQPLPPPIN